MPYFNLFSSRRKNASGVPTIYTYDAFSEKLRVQAVHIIRASLGCYRNDITGSSPSHVYWDEIHDILCREYGIPQIGYSADVANNISEFIVNCNDEQFLDTIEACFKCINGPIRNLSNADKFYSKITQDPDDAIEELNHRFAQGGYGYEFQTHELIRIDDQFIHKEITQPALHLLHVLQFTPVIEEFLRAHKHYKEQNFVNSIDDSFKAFESTMKIICEKNNWPVSNPATAKNLIEVIFKKELIPKELSSHMTALKSTLESGLPSVANNLSRHGRGSAPIAADENLAAYCLHLCATNIVFLCNCHVACNKKAAKMLADHKG